jgi:glycosyltransferase involved in cell wall biosynthesis
MDILWGLFRRSIRAVGTLLAAPAFLIVAAAVVMLARRARREGKPRLVWGSTPLINNSYWSRGMRKAGFESDTFVTHVYSVYKRENFDRLLVEQYRWAPESWKPYVAFFHAMFVYDVFFIAFDGFFIGHTPFAYLQARILRLAGKKMVVIPYGSDALIYRRIRGVSTIHGLMMSYPQASRDQERIARNVDYWVANADAVIPAIIGPDGFGRWDALLPTALFIDLDGWRPSTRSSMADGASAPVTITHAPNHRGFKGTEFVIEAVRILKAEGLKIELHLLEGIPNTEVRRILREETDVLVEQLVSIGHGLNGLEGLASGLPVISNLEDEAYVTPLRRWSYFGECPVVSASPETLVDVLRKLITRPHLRHELGRASRAYAEKYHGLDSAHYLFTNVIDFVYGRRDSMINLYHPLLGEYPRRSPKIQHPLVNNRIVEA